MEKEPSLNDPWLVAAWPGMGAVTLSAEVKDGLIQTGRLPRSRLFL